MKNTDFDINKLRERYTKAIGQRNNINDTVLKHSKIIFDYIVDNFLIIPDHMSIRCTGTSWWNNGYDLTFIFKKKGADISITVNKKGFYEIKLYQHRPIVMETIHFLPDEINEMTLPISTWLKKYEFDHQLIFERVTKAVIFTRNTTALWTFKNISDRFCDYECIGGSGQGNFHPYQYVVPTYPTYNYKYIITYRNNERVMFLSTNVTETTFEIVAVLIELQYNHPQYKHTLPLTLESGLSNEENIKKTLDWLNWSINIETPANHIMH